MRMWAAAASARTSWPVVRAALGAEMSATARTAVDICGGASFGTRMHDVRSLEEVDPVHPVEVKSDRVSDGDQ
jgi:hypothetical protein